MSRPEQVIAGRTGVFLWTELGTAGLPLSPVLLSAGKWAAIWAGIAAFGVVSSRIFIRFPEDPPFNILNEVCVVTGAATLAGNLAAVLCILLKFEDDGQSPRSMGFPLGGVVPPTTAPERRGHSTAGKDQRRTTALIGGHR